MSINESQFHDNIPLKTVMNTVLDGLIIINSQAIIQYFNPAACTLFGYSEKEVIGRNVSILMPEPYHSEHDQYLVNYIKTKAPQIIGTGREVEAKCKNGKVFPIKLVVNEMLLNGETFFVGTIHNIEVERKTEQLVAEYKDSLSESEFMFQTFIESSYDGYWDWHIQDDFEYMSPRFWEMLGYKPEEKRHHPSEWQKQISEKSLEAALDSFDKHVKTKGKHPFHQEVEYYHKDGSVVQIICKGKVVEWDEDDQPVRMIGTHTDITRQKEIQNKRLLEKKYLELSDKIGGVGHWRVDVEEEKIFWSDEIYVIHGVTPEEYTPELRSAIDFYHPEDQQKVREYVVSAFETKEPFEFRLRLVQPSGDIRYVFARGQVLEINDKIIMIGIFQDVTEETLLVLKLEETLLRLKESDKFHKLIIESNPDYIFVKDNQFRIVEANKAFLELYPRSKRNHVIGYTTVESYEKAEADKFLEQDRVAFKDGYSETIEKVTFPDGRIRVLFTKKTRFENEKGKQFILGIARDITETEWLIEELRASNELNTAIMMNSQHLIITTDKEGLITSFNPAAEQSLGYKACEVIGKETPALWHDGNELREHATLLSQELNQEILPGFEVFVIKAQTDGSISGDWTFIRKDRSRFPVTLTVTCLKNKEREIIGYLGVVKDVSERKRIEKEREKLIKELQRSNKELDDFAHIASHDLKEPLRGIHNYASFLIEDYEEQLDQDGKDKLQTLKRLSQRMEQLLNELLYYSRIHRKEVECKQVSIREILEGVTDILSPVIQEENAEIIIQDDISPVKGEKILLNELYTNLIVNALKYNDKEHKKVEIGHNDDSNKGIVYFVRDNGIGIDKKHQNSVFKIFKRLHSRKKYGDGTGFGLTIAQKIVHHHGGKIWLESEPGVGTTFYFTLEKRLKDG